MNPPPFSQTYRLIVFFAARLNFGEAFPTDAFAKACFDDLVFEIETVLDFILVLDFTATGVLTGARGPIPGPVGPAGLAVFLGGFKLC